MVIVLQQSRHLIAIAIAILCSLSQAVIASELEQLLLQQQYEQILMQISQQQATNRDTAIERVIAYSLALEKSGNLAGAIGVMEQHTQRKDISVEFANNLALLYARKQEYALAEQWLNRGLKLDPRFATVHSNLQQIFTLQASAAYIAALETDIQAPLLQLQPLIPQTEPDLAKEQAATTSVVATVAPPACPQAKPVVQVVEKSCPPPQQQQPSTTDDDFVKQQQQAVQQLIQFWSDSWQQHKVDHYIDSYFPGYHSDKFITHNSWAEYRKQRILAAKNITISIEKLTLSEPVRGQIRAEFTMHYRADHYADISRKRIDLLAINGMWKIFDEQTLQVERVK